MTYKPVIEKLFEDTGQSFLFREIIRPKRPDHRSSGVWHYHPDFEITLSLISSGKRFVGYSIDDYFPRELVLLGENLPHCWITNKAVKQYVINFKKETLGDTFWSSHEFLGIKKLLHKSKQGIKFSETTTEKAIPLIMEMKQKYNFHRLIIFFELLNLLASSEAIELLTFQNYQIKDTFKASNRIERVYSYIFQNYKEENISVSNLSEELHMTVSSLCKFIKKVTKKTFTNLLLEYRISEACKLLSETDKYISEIRYLCGFNCKVYLVSIGHLRK